MARRLRASGRRRTKEGVQVAAGVDRRAGEEVVHRAAVARGVAAHGGKRVVAKHERVLCARRVGRVQTRREAVEVALIQQAEKVVRA